MSTTTTTTNTNYNNKQARYARILGPFSDLLSERDTLEYFFSPDYLRPARPKTYYSRNYYCSRRR